MCVPAFVKQSNLTSAIGGLCRLAKGQSKCVSEQMFIYQPECLHIFLVTGEEHNFMKLSGGEIDSRNEPYDYGSIMHYGKNTFSKAVSLETIIARKRPMSILRPQIGQREKLSRGDIRQTKKMYHCPGKSLEEKTTSQTSQLNCTQFRYPAEEQ